jgi:hypothetical protein
MSSPMPDEVTGLLLAWSQGDEGALQKLVPMVYEELRRLAHRYMSQERAGHTLQTTALVHEVYQRLIDTPHVGWHDRTHFLAVCAQFMRRIDRAGSESQLPDLFLAQTPDKRAKIIIPEERKIVARDLKHYNSRQCGLIVMRCIPPRVPLVRLSAIKNGHGSKHFGNLRNQGAN